MKNLYMSLFVFTVLLPSMLRAQQRPSLLTEQTYDSDHFKFHYTTDSASADKLIDERDKYPEPNGIPDMVEQLAYTFELVYYPQYHNQTFTFVSLQTWGLKTPPSDGTRGGDSRYDVYLKNLSVKGRCVSEFYANTSDNSTVTYICINSQQPSLDIEITLVHEYMHAIQMGYGDMPPWFKESVANWGVANMPGCGPGETVWDLENLFNKTDVAVNYQDSELNGQFEGHDYAMWMFIQYLTDQTDVSLIRKLYERVAQTPAHTGSARTGRVVHGEMTELIDQELKENWNSSLDEIMIKYAVSNQIMDDDNIFQPYTYSYASELKQYALKFLEPVFENSSALHFSGTDITWNSQTDGNGRLMRLSYDCLELTADKNFKVTISPVPSANKASLVVVKAKKEVQSYGFVHEWVTTDAEVVISKSGKIVVDDNADWTHIYPMVVRTDQSILAGDTTMNYELKITEYIPDVNVHKLTFNIHDHTGAVINHAVVTLDGDKYSYSKGSTTIKDLADGTYPYTIKANSYITQTGSVTINEQDKNIDIFMQSYAKIAVRHDDYWYENKSSAYPGVFGNNDITGETEEQTLYIYNKGGIALNIYDVSLSGRDAADFTIISSPSSPIAAGDSAALKIKFDPSQIDWKAATISITCNDPEANPFMFNIDGRGESVPIPRVEGNNIYISPFTNKAGKNDGTDFGEVDTAGCYVDRTFTLKNIGSALLKDCSVYLYEKDFSVREQPDSVILPGDSTTFTLRFDPKTDGLKSDRLVITGNFETDNFGTYYYFNIDGTGIEPTAVYPKLVFKGNGIVIDNLDDTPSVTDSTFFGTTDIFGGFIDKSFTIRNTGEAPLIQTMMHVVQKTYYKDKLYFSFLSQPDAAIAPGDSSTFIVRFLPTKTGVHNARVLVFYNTNQTNYFQIQGKATNGSEIAVEGNDTEITDGDDSPNVADNSDFGTAEILNGAVDHTFTIKNTGTYDLNVSTPVISGKNSACFSLVSPPAGVINPGGNTSFTVRFAPGQTGNKAAEILIENKDADENPFNFTIQGTGILTKSPEIVVEGNNIEIADKNTTLSLSDNTYFGNVSSSTPEIIKSFIIKNSGTSDLYISTPYIFNDTSGSFTVVSQPAGIVAPNGQTKFDISYKPATPGTHRASVSIPNSDSDENAFAFFIQGTNNNSGYSLILNITDGTNPVENAIVTFNGVSYTADANGRLEIQYLVNGNYSYTVSAAGYWSQNMNTAISSGDNTENITLYEQIFVVTFYDWDNTALKQVTAKYNETASAPADPVRTGYTFTGWNKDISTITSDLTVTAQYTINTYTVTFEDHDGTELKNETVEYGKAATAPQDPIRAGYTFTGWNAEYSNVTSNLTITAQYTLASSVREREEENNAVKIYPNPAKNLLTIDAGDLYLKDRVTIINITGCSVLQTNNNAKQTIDISNLPCGIYFVKAGSIIKKIVKE